MSDVISPTQRQLTPQDVAGLLKERFDRTVVHCGPLTGGTFAAVWRVALDDGTEAVVKVGPPAGCRLLRYERGIIAAEARYYRLVRQHVPTVPVPAVLHADDDVVVVGLLPGRPLTELPEGADAGGVRTQLGAALKELHTVTGTAFGYDGGGRAGGATWREAFTAMTEDLLADARDWQVELPACDADILATVERHSDALDEVTRPALVHFDLWDGNVLCQDGVFTGLVDGERYFWGDPLYDFVCTAIGHRLEDERDHPVLRGYHGGTAPELTAEEKTRLALYRVQFYLLLLAEMPSRAMVGEVARERRAWVTPLLEHDLETLRR
ncbi:aminoglycoside phosphotransferase family protein [Dactylosporangium sp. AC04546]|uniref:phosphotransferase family protein n=1 Tax=Dactylosporangium sp. AC04546 TaxID=2862460 RepID=UPI001EDF56B0|nr:aminoglycoside phosphotransferase family protein [Dactylosporangium sp. AC04546]WVK79755.1 aminoglycoside phosphotransferase family protein [Dactylosporangium sp. AC04546]